MMLGSRVFRVRCTLPSWSRIHKATIYTGRATPEGTKGYSENTAKQSPNLSHTILPRSEWTVNRLGFSGCKLQSNSNDHKASLDAALASLTNFVSVPAGGEVLLAKVLSPLIDFKDLTREQVVISVKMGILRAAQLKDLTTTFEQADIYNKDKELHKYMYSISPDFLKYKIEDSLKVLDLDCLDLVMLDDPVFNFLQEHQGSAEEMYNRITKAFVYLEKEAVSGRIQYYGISSDSFLLPSDSPNHLSLSRLIQIAKSNNLQYFAAIEYPHNILENGAYTLANNNQNTKTVNQLAREHNLMQIGNRPLTLTQFGRQFRLKSLSKHEDRDIDGLMNESFKFCTMLEKQSPVALQEELNIDFSYPSVNDVIWTQHLGANLLDGAHYLYKYLNWLELEAKPKLERACAQLCKNDKFVAWSVRYKAAIEALFIRCQWVLERSSYITASQLELSMARKSEQLQDLTLAHQGLRIALSGGPDVVLTGMRVPANLSHTSQLNQNILISPSSLLSLFSQMRFITSLFRTDEAIGWYEPGNKNNNNNNNNNNSEEFLEVEIVSFGSPPTEGSVSEIIRKKQIADPIKYDSPIY